MKKRVLVATDAQTSKDFINELKRPYSSIHSSQQFGTKMKNNGLPPSADLLN